MLLRESSLHDGSELDLNSIHGEALDRCGIAHARLLVDFAEAAVAGEGSKLSTLRDTLGERLGAEAAVDVAATVAIFTAVVRIADGIGIPLEPKKEEGSHALRAQLGLDAYASGRQD